MTTIALHKYHAQIEQMLEEGQADLAAQHCRQILQQQPQHVATYRLLAKSLLEMDDYPGARDMFQRILSADPNDYIAHAGLAIVYKEEGIAPQAIWHLERAYEIEPYNSAIQQELRVLYVEHVKSQRNGRSKDDQLPALSSLPLTDGAVARLYLRSEMYEQAIDLLRQALAEDEDRIDLRVLLLEALWRDGRRMEAVNACLQVLDVLPNCIVAIAILAEIWLRTGRIDEAQTYLQRVQALTLPDATRLDGDSVAGCAFRTEGAPALPDEVQIEYIGSDALLVEEDSGPPLPKVTQPPSPKTDESETVPEKAEEDDLFGWLEGLTGELPPVEEGVRETAVSSLLSSDWLADLPDDEPDEEPDAAQAGVTDLDDDLDDLQRLEWLGGELSTPAEETDSLGEAESAPDWLADLAGDDLEPLQMDSLTAASWFSESDETGEEEDDLDWLTPLEGEVATDLEVEGPGDLDLSQFVDFADDEEEEEEEVFEWRLTDELKEKTETAVATGDLGLAALDRSPAESAEEPAEIPDWLMSSMQLEEIDDGDDLLISDEMVDEFADWVAAQNAGVAVEQDDAAWLEDAEMADETAVSPADAALDWAAGLEDEKAESAPLETGDLPDWLRGDSLDLPDSAPLAEPLPEGEDEAHLAAPLVWPSAEETSVEEISAWALAEDDDEEPDEPAVEIAETFVVAGVDLEEVVSDDKEEKSTEPQDGADDWLEESADSLDWLDDLTTMALSDAAEEDALFGAADALPDWLQVEDRPAPEPRLEVDDSEAVEGETAVAEENLDWLDALVAIGAEAESVDEQPTWQWPEEQPEPEAALDAALETLFAVDEEGAAEEEELEEFSFATAESLEPADEDFPDDLDDAMSWLEKLAGDPGAPVEELPSVAARLDEETFPELDLADALLVDDVLGVEDEFALPPDDPEAAMAWLEQLAARQGAPLDELPSVSEEPTREPVVEPEADAFDTGLLAAELGELPADEALTLFDDLDDLDEIPLDDLSLAVPEDPDEAMAWLEQLAARQGAPLDELPSVEKPPLVEEVADELPLELADATWLDELTFEEADERPLSPEPPALAETGELGSAPPDDLDEAMAWLEQLAARQGAPLDELPLVSDQAWAETAVTPSEAEESDAEEAEIEAFAEVDFDLFAAETEAEPAELDPLDELDETMAWLSELESEETDADDDWLRVSEEPSEEPEEAPLLVEDPMLLLEETPPLEMEETAVPTFVDESLLAELAWLEEVSGAAGEAAPAAELAEIEVDEAELAAALDFLEAMAGAPAEATTHQPPAIEEAEKSAALTADADLIPDETWADLWPDSPMEEPSAETLDALDDLFGEELTEEVLADLFLAEEVLAEPDEEVTLEESAEVEQETLAAATDFEAELLDSIPDDPDAAMAWLEQLAARQGAPLDELPSIKEMPPVSDEKIVALDAFDLVGEEEEERVAETAVAPTDLPEDIEDVMAWLEQLAARQGASLDELPTVSDADQEIITPAWIAAAQLAGEEEAELEPAPSDPEEAEDAPEATESELFAAIDLEDIDLEEEQEAALLFGAEAEAEIEIADDLVTISTDELSQELAESGDTLPDWLSLEDEDSDDRILGHTDWLGALPEPDLDSWLAAEEEVTTRSPADFSGDSGPLPEIDTRPFAAELIEPVDIDEDLLIPDLDFGQSAVELDEVRLGVAQQALATGQFEAALADYAALVETGEGLNTIIADLEVATGQHRDQPLLRRTLGDAYMRNGQLQKALETYRQALDQL